ncbi:putative ATP-grasp-modified RiPP [Streptomyces sp. NPDC006923]|uniref:putative ATP-grasp-modified RiPP n=1 Tax=Streptomyces sp. NPDC006923 TaxID=3155355 RepID=UPI0033F7B378
MTPSSLLGGTLAPPLFPYPGPTSEAGPVTSVVRPFGLARAVPVRPETDVWPALVLCPERQIGVTVDGEPFIHAPSMKSKFETTSQTKEDSQLADDKENDTD